MNTALLAKILADGRRMKILRADADRLGAGIDRERATDALLDLLALRERWGV